MMEHTTDRLFWTLTSIIVGALILTIGINAFPKATQGVIQPISGVIKQADTTTHTADSAANVVMSNDNNSNNSNSNNSSSSQSSTPTDPDTQAKTNAVEANTLGFTVSDNGNGTGTITGYNVSKGTDVNIPKYVKSNGILLKITNIDSNNSYVGPFAYKNLTSVTIPNSVTNIGPYAFAGDKLTSINIPNSVTTIGDSAFYENWNVASLTIPNSVTNIGPYAFSYDGLTSVNIPNSVTNIGSYAFGSNYPLTSANIPNAQGYQSAKANGAFNFDRVKVTNNPSSN